jgi:hypothetical protein
MTKIIGIGLTVVFVIAVVTENSVRAGNAKILSACRHSLPEKLIEGTIQ